jgi:hypothetical protein
MIWSELFSCLSMDEKQIGQTLSQLDLDALIDKINALIDMPLIGEKTERAIIAFVFEVILSLLMSAKNTLNHPDA